MNEKIAKICTEEMISLSVGKMIIKEAQKELLIELNDWRHKITSMNFTCEENEEVEIMNYELKDWINEKLGEDN